VDLVLYQYGGGNVTDACQLTGAPILGTGIGNFSFTTEAGSGGALALHVTAQGTIALVSGGRARVLGEARVLVRPDGTLLFDQETVRLTPD